MIAALAFAIPVALFLAFPSCQWNFDGVACAAALELGEPLHYFHSNHLIYAWLGRLFWQGTGWAFGHPRALPMLQVFTILLSGAGLLAIYKLLSERFLPPISALLATVAIASTAVVWTWSIEAQVYTLGFAGVAWSTYFLLTGAPSTTKYRSVGIWNAIAVLGHVMHFLWAVPAIFWIYRETRRATYSFWKALAVYLAWLLGVVGATYALVLSIVVWPRLHDHPGSTLIWLKGSAGLTPDRHWAWHSAGISAPWQWLKTTLNFFWGAFWPYEHIHVPGWTWALTALSIIGFLAAFASAFRSKDDCDARFFSFLWIAVYALLFWSWEPRTECYRLAEAVPFSLWLAIGVKDWKVPAQRALFGVLIATTIAVTLRTRVIPMHDRNLNRTYMQILRVGEMTPPTSVYLTSGSNPWIYLVYFTGRPAWSANSAAGQALMAGFASKAQRPAFYAEWNLLDDPTVGPWLRHFKLNLIAPDLPWLQVQ